MSNVRLQNNKLTRKIQKMNNKTIKIISVAVHLLTTIVISSQVQAEQKSNADFKLTNSYIKKSVEMRAFDETSLRWRDIKISKNGKYGCATFNGKNRYGAYAGYSTMGFGVLEDNTVGVALNDEYCYDMVSAHNYRDTPEGRAKYEKQKIADEESKKLKAYEIAEIEKKIKQDEENRIIKDEEDSKRREAESLENEKKYQENKTKEEADLQIAIEKSKTEAEEHNRKTNEKVARDEAEQQRVIDKDKVKGLIPKKLFDLLPK